MTTRTQHINATPETVWEVLADGWLYPLWVVGASRMRDVDETWPQVGSRLHHSVGTWPMLIDDATEVKEVDPGRLLVLHARAWPAGTAEVRIEVESDGSGGTQLSMWEDAVKGPGVLMPRPARALGLQWRNNEALRRLALLCEGRA